MAIHAAQKCVFWERLTERLREAILRVAEHFGWAISGIARNRIDIGMLPRGAIVAVCRFIRCWPAGEADYNVRECLFGDWTPGRFA